MRKDYQCLTFSLLNERRPARVHSLSYKKVPQIEYAKLEQELVSRETVYIES